MTVRVAHSLAGDDPPSWGNTVCCLDLFSAEVKFWAGFSSQIHRLLQRWQHSVLRVGRTVVRNTSPNVSEVQMVFADSVGQEVLAEGGRKEEENVVSWLFPGW